MKLLYHGLHYTLICGASQFYIVLMFWVIQYLNIEYSSSVCKNYSGILMLFFLCWLIAYYVQGGRLIVGNSLLILDAKLEVIVIAQVT